MNKAELIAVSKVFGEKKVLNGFSLTVKAGERYCIMGPSGCGKTTLLRLLTGLETPDAGEVKLDKSEKKAWVFQEDRLIAHMSSVQNCALTAEKPDREKIEALLTEAGLGGSMNEPARNLSGGMARRTAIVRALTSGADFFIMDEPLKGLDEETKKKVLAIIDRETKGRTLVYVTHVREEYEALGGTLVEMK